MCANDKDHAYNQAIVEAAALIVEKVFENTGSVEQSVEYGNVVLSLKKRIPSGLGCDTFMG